VKQLDEEYPEQLKLENQLCFLLYSASRLMTRLYRPLLDEIGLTYPQYLVMLVLWESKGKPLSIGEVGDLLMLDTGTLTPLLKRLEQNDLLSRVRSKEDERRVELVLTEEGQALRLKAEQVPLKLMCQADMSEADMTAQVEIKDLMKELNQRLFKISQR